MNVFATASIFCCVNFKMTSTKATYAAYRAFELLELVATSSRCAALSARFLHEHDVVILTVAPYLWPCWPQKLVACPFRRANPFLKR